MLAGQWARQGVVMLSHSFVAGSFIYLVFALCFAFFSLTSVCAVSSLALQTSLLGTISFSKSISDWGTWEVEANPRGDGVCVLLSFLVVINCHSRVCVCLALRQSPDIIYIFKMNGMEWCDSFAGTCEIRLLRGGWRSTHRACGLAAGSCRLVNVLSII